MENFDLDTSTVYRKNKLKVIIGAVILTILTNVALFWVEGNTSIEPIINLVLMIGLGFCILLWCTLDSRERDEELGSGFRFLLVLFGVFALVVYLFKTRDFKRGLIAFGYLLLVFIVYVLLSAAVLTSLELIFKG